MTPELAEADCAACRAPVVAVEMRDGDSEILDAEHFSETAQMVVINQHGVGLPVRRVYNRHAWTCIANRRKGSKRHG